MNFLGLVAVGAASGIVFAAFVTLMWACSRARSVRGEVLAAVLALVGLASAYIPGLSIAGWASDLGLLSGMSDRILMIIWAVHGFVFAMLVARWTRVSERITAALDRRPPTDD